MGRGRGGGRRDVQMWLPKWERKKILADKDPPSIHPWKGGREEEEEEEGEEGGGGFPITLLEG